jgi:hypothetical protein
MPDLIKNFLVTASAVVLLGMVLLDSSCKKEENKDDDILSCKEFISVINGEWEVIGFRRTHADLNNHNNYYCYWITLSGDSVKYSADHYFSDSTRFYSKEDPVLCTLPYMENMGIWIFTEKNNDLFLKMVSYCGDTSNYDVVLKSFNYNDESSDIFHYMPAKYLIEVDLTLVSQGPAIKFEYFWLYPKGSFHNESLISCVIGKAPDMSEFGLIHK